jgi:hypothetical protein
VIENIILSIGKDEFGDVLFVSISSQNAGPPGSA